MKDNTKIKTGNLEVRANFSPDTIVEDSRTVEIVASTETPYRRYDWWSDVSYDEVLAIDKASIRSDRLDRGISLLDNHDRYRGIDGVLGIVESYRIEDKQLIATVRFDSGERGQDAFRKVKEGILRSASIGYVVHKYQKEPKKTGEVPIYRAVDWEPMELSLVTVPADPNAVVRSSDQSDESKLYFVPITNPTNQMNEDLTRQDGGQAAVTPTVIEPAKATPAASATESEAVRMAKEAERKLERDRVKAIRERGLAVGLEQDFINRHIDEGTGLDEFYRLAMEKLVEKNPKINTSIGRVEEGASDKKRFVEGAETAMMLRSGKLKEADLKNTEEGRRKLEFARTYRQSTLLDLVRYSLDDQGINHRGMDRFELLRTAVTSSGSDFPILLAGIARNTLLAEYNTQADTHKRFTSTGSVNDFRDYRRTRMATSFNELELVGQNAEYKVLSMADGEFENVRVNKRGNIFNVSFEMIIDDDLGALTRLASMIGRTAARSREIAVYRLLTSGNGLGPVMQDGKTLFHADHGNIATTAENLSIAAIDRIKSQMKRQKQVGGVADDYLDLKPEILLVPTEWESQANVLNKSQYDVDVNQKTAFYPNKVVGLFNDIVGTARLSGNAWYVFADPNIVPVIEVTSLTGYDAPYMEEKASFEQDGINWKIRDIWGVNVVDYRGIIRNAGA